MIGAEVAAAVEARIRLAGALADCLGATLIGLVVPLPRRLRIRCTDEGRFPGRGWGTAMPKTAKATVLVRPGRVGARGGPDGGLVGN